MIAACRPPSSTPGKVSWSQRGRMRAASSTNKIARMLGPASHMCQPANERLGMLAKHPTHVAGGQSGGERAWTAWRKVCGITSFGNPGHIDLLEHILPRD